VRKKKFTHNFIPVAYSSVRNDYHQKINHPSDIKYVI